MGAKSTQRRWRSGLSQKGCGGGRRRGERRRRGKRNIKDVMYLPTFHINCITSVWALVFMTSWVLVCVVGLGPRLGSRVRHSFTPVSPTSQSVQSASQSKQSVQPVSPLADASTSQSSQSCMRMYVYMYMCTMQSNARYVYVCACVYVSRVPHDAP